MNKEKQAKTKKSGSSTRQTIHNLQQKVTIEIWMIYKDYVYNRLFF
jgi:hypothetical protein